MPLPEDEDARLRALYHYEILDTTADPRFDQIATLASRIFEVPIALVSFVDRRRQWIKAGCGIDVRETCREIAFCAHTITTNRVLQIEDALLDPRFAENPLVTGPPFLRFYAGAPLHAAQGCNLGALCLIDTKPRSLDARQEQLLMDLAGMVVKELDQRYTMLQMEKQSGKHKYVVTERDQIVNSLSSVLIGLNEDLIISHWNRAAEQILHKPTTLMLGTSFRDCRLSWDLDGILSGIEHCRKTGQAVRLPDVSFELHRNAPRILGISISPVHKEEGGTSGFILLAADITDKRKSEAALATAVRELERLNVSLVEARDAALAADKMKSQFLSNTSHELRTPLNGILGIAGLLTETKVDALQRHYLRIIKQSAGSLLTLINDILDFSKTQSGKMRLELAPFSLYDIMEEAAALLAPRAFEKGLDFCCDLPSLPVSLTSADRVEGDGSRIRQILLNLLGNAIKFTSSGEIVLGAELLSETPQEAQWRLYVRDTGIGIPQEMQSAIFDSFTQTDGSTTRRYGGTGLGLTICRQLVTLMAGQIGVSSECGRGSLFWIEITLKKQATYADTEEVILRQLLDGLPILIADVHATQRQSLHKLLSSWGCQVSEAASESELIQQIQQMSGQNRRQVILMDGCMPCSSSETAHLIQQSIHGSGIETVTLLAPGKPCPSPEAVVPGGATILKPICRREIRDCLLSLTKSSGSQQILFNSSEELPLLPDRIQSKAKILLVEDDSLNQMVAQSLLIRCGISSDRITMVSNGQQMLNQLENCRFDLILTDIEMPEMDGLSAVKYLRERERKTASKPIPVIALTGHTHPDRLKAFMAAGIDDCICRPLEWIKLHEALVQWLPSKPPALHPTGRRESAPGDSAGYTEDNGAEQQPAIWDRERLRKVTGGDSALEQRLLTELKTSLPKMLQRCRFAIEMEDSSAIEHAAHTMKGSCRTLGILRMDSLCRRLEDCGRDNSLAETASLLAQMEREWQNAQSLMETWSVYG